MTDTQELTGYPGNGQHPVPYMWVSVITYKKQKGRAYWSGNRWVTDGTWRINSYGSDHIYKWWL